MLINVSFKKEGRKKRHRSARKRIEGTAERPRLAVFRSAKHIYAQVIDDRARRRRSSRPRTRSTRRAAMPIRRSAPKEGRRRHRESKCKEKGIDKVVFDRAGYSITDASQRSPRVRGEAGLKF
jgi:large subunit ribosomal protein L18